LHDLLLLSASFAEKRFCAFASSFIKPAPVSLTKAAAQNNSGVDQPWIIAQRTRPARSDAIMFSQRTNSQLSATLAIAPGSRQGLSRSPGARAWCQLPVKVDQGAVTLVAASFGIMVSAAIPEWPPPLDCGAGIDS